MSLLERLEGKEVVVCAGPGGVGKTTSAAAVALGMAARGLKVAVVTIDPARRLATSLGLAELGNEERRIDPERLAGADLPVAGELWAMMLDAKRTFDALIERHAPDERTREAVLENRIYQELSSAVAGSQEYMAMEKLHELHAKGRYDLLVLDTPPSRNALDFLDAPERLRRFVDSRSLQVFLGGNRGGLKLMGRSGTVLFSVLGRVTGVDLLQDLSDFFRAFGDMSQGFRDRAQQVNELLADERSAFLIVSSPRPESVDEALFFRRRMGESGLPFGGAIVNRMHALPAGTSDPGLEDELARLLDPSLAARLTRNLADYRALAERDTAGVERLTAELGEPPAVVIPAFEDDVHDLAGLARLDEHLFGLPSPYGRTAT